MVRDPSNGVTFVKTMAVMIVDDDRLMATLLTACLKEKPGIQVVGCAGGEAEALSLAARKKPDLILLDIELPGTDGVDLVPLLRREAPKTKIIMLSGHCDAYTIYRVMQVRVQGYVDKPNPIEMVIEAIDRVLKGGTFFSPTFTEGKHALLESPEGFHRILSHREQEVMRWVRDGISDAKIAMKHGISAQTVAAHRKNIRRKLDLHSDREIVAYARRWGIRMMGSLPQNVPLEG